MKLPARWRRSTWVALDAEQYDRLSAHLEDGCGLQDWPRVRLPGRGPCRVARLTCADAARLEEMIHSTAEFERVFSELVMAQARADAATDTH